MTVPPPLGGGTGLTKGAKLQRGGVVILKSGTDNHLAEFVRSKPGRPGYMGKRHMPPPPPFWAFLGLFAYPSPKG